MVLRYNRDPATRTIRQQIGQGSVRAQVSAYSTPCARESYLLCTTFDSSTVIFRFDLSGMHPQMVGYTHALFCYWFCTFGPPISPLRYISTQYPCPFSPHSRVALASIWHSRNSYDRICLTGSLLLPTKKG